MKSGRDKHPNRILFEGVLTRLDEPSDSAPSGSRGHRVILTREAAEDALDSLIGMAVAYKQDWDGHDARQKCGVITDAYIHLDELLVKGYIYGRDFPEVTAEMMKPNVELGMSYELADAHVADMREKIWTLTRATFTGAAILLRKKAAYKRTRISLIAATREVFTGKLRSQGGKVKLLH